MKVKGERQSKTPPILDLFFTAFGEKILSVLTFSFVFPLLDAIPKDSSPFVYFTRVFYGSHPALSPLEFPIQGQFVLSLLLNERRHGAPRQSATAFPSTLCSAGSSGSSTPWNIPTPVFFTPGLTFAPQTSISLSPCLQLQRVFVLPWSLVNSLSGEKCVFWWKE